MVQGDLDRLDLELRCIPGVVAVGFDTAPRNLLVQVVVLSEVTAPDLRGRLRRTIEANVREPAELELVVDATGLTPAYAGS
jgi:hypothetical protein